MIIKPPKPFKNESFLDPLIFLAGSIEMGTAIDWQDEISKKIDRPDRIILNPRREDWDDTWKQDISDPKFREQVEWELKGIEDASLTVFFFHPKTKSPISLLELGLAAPLGACIVCCPTGFWRKGNVDIICAKYKLKTVDKYEDLGKTVEDYLNMYY